jgi:hypothetical protein
MRGLAYLRFSRLQLCGWRLRYAQTQPEAVCKSVRLAYGIAYAVYVLLACSIAYVVI